MFTRLPLTRKWPWRTSWRASGVVRGEAQTVDDVVQAPLEQLEQVLARDALQADRLVVVAAELPLGDAVDALDLLLLAKLLDP